MRLLPQEVQIKIVGAVELELLQAQEKQLVGLKASWTE